MACRKISLALLPCSLMMGPLVVPVSARRSGRAVVYVDFSVAPNPPDEPEPRPPERGRHPPRQVRAPQASPTVKSNTVRPRGADGTGVEAGAGPKRRSGQGRSKNLRHSTTYGTVSYGTVA